MSFSLGFSLAFYWPPHFSFSLSLSLSLYILLFSFFLLVFLFCFLLVPCFCLFFLPSLLWFHERNNTKIKTLQSFFFINPFSFLGFLSCFLFEVPYSYLCFFLILSYAFAQHQCFCFQNKQVEKHQFLVKRGLQQNVFFYELCSAKCEKLSFFGHFWGNFWLRFKKHYKHRYFSTC